MHNNFQGSDFYLWVFFNQGVVFLHRLATASFYYLAALFVEKWIKSNEQQP